MFSARIIHKYFKRYSQGKSYNFANKQKYIKLFV